MASLATFTASLAIKFPKCIQKKKNHPKFPLQPKHLPAARGWLQSPLRAGCEHRADSLLTQHRDQLSKEEEGAKPMHPLLSFLRNPAPACHRPHVGRESHSRCARKKKGKKAAHGLQTGLAMQAGLWVPLTMGQTADFRP